MSKHMDGVTVGKDGNVTRNGDLIGRVFKRDAGLGLVETHGGMAIGVSGGAKWHAENVAGEAVNTYGYRTRKEAVAQLAADTAPMVAYDFKREMLRPAFSGEPRECITGSLAFKGHTFGLSRYTHETYWVVDSKWGPNMFPHFANGVGSRVTNPQVLQGDADVAATTAAQEAGLL